MGGSICRILRGLEASRGPDSNQLNRLRGSAKKTNTRGSGPWRFGIQKLGVWMFGVRKLEVWMFGSLDVWRSLDVGMLGCLEIWKSWKFGCLEMFGC